MSESRGRASALFESRECDYAGRDQSQFCNVASRGSSGEFEYDSVRGNCGGRNAAVDFNDEAMKNFYAILEVLPTASVEVIRASAKTLSARYHPDNKKGTANAAKFRAVREALECLTDPDQRAAHDAQLNGNGHRPQEPFQYPGATKRVWANGFGWVEVPVEAGPFPSDRPAYPDAYPGMTPNVQQMAQEAAHELAHELVDEMLRKMFRGRFR